MTGSVTLSLSELRSLVTKATRGAGLGWGLAEEAGWAAEWLARRRMPAADWARLWLSERIEGKISPVEVGVMLADDPENSVAAPDAALPDGLSAPGYLLPFLHRAALGRAPVAIRAQGELVVRVTPDGEVEFGPHWQARSSGWNFVKGDTEDRPGTSSRPTLSGSTHEWLEALALRTTVPQSESSRRDAGSNMGDND